MHPAPLCGAMARSAIHALSGPAKAAWKGPAHPSPKAGAPNPAWPVDCATGPGCQPRTVRYPAGDATQSVAGGIPTRSVGTRDGYLAAVRRPGLDCPDAGGDPAGVRARWAASGAALRLGLVRGLGQEPAVLRGYVGATGMLPSPPVGGRCRDRRLRVGDLTSRCPRGATHAPTGLAPLLGLASRRKLRPVSPPGGRHAHRQYP